MEWETVHSVKLGLGILNSRANDGGVSFRGVKVEVEDVSKVVKRAKKHLNCRGLNFENCGLDDNGAKILFEFLDINKNPLSALQLNDNAITSESLDVLAKSLKSNYALQELDLSGNDIDGSGGALLAAALNGSVSLKRLNLRKNRNFGDKGAEALALCLLNNDFLESLDLSRCGIGLIGCSAIAETIIKNKSLKSLNLEGNSMDIVSSVRLSKGLQVNSSLTSLDVSSNGFGHVGAYSLVSALKENTTLRSIDISNNNVNEDVCAQIGEALSMNNGLQTFKIARNNIGDNGTDEIFEAIQYNTGTLTSLDLSGNNITEDGAAKLEEVLKGIDTDVQILNLSGNNIRDRGTKRIARSLKLNQSLTYLDLSNNNLRDESAKYLADALPHNATLSTLILTGNAIGTSGLISLTDALEKNSSIFDLQLSSRHKQKIDDKLNEANEKKKQIGKDMVNFVIKNVESVNWNRLKLMVVGKEGSGKSTLIKSLLGQAFDPAWEKTAGVTTQHSVIEKTTLDSKWKKRERGNRGETDFDEVILRAGRMELKKKNNGPDSNSNEVLDLRKALLEENKKQRQTLLEENKRRMRASTNNPKYKKKKKKKKGQKSKQKAANKVDQSAQISGNLTFSENMSKNASKGGKQKPSSLQVKEKNQPNQKSESKVKVQAGWETNEETSTLDDSLKRKQLRTSNLQYRSKPDLLDEEEVDRRYGDDVVSKLFKTEEKENRDNFSFMVWDYGGQREFYSMHHLFLTKLGIYLVVFDIEAILSEDEALVEDSIDRLSWWMKMVFLHGGNEAPVILVGTKLSRLPETEREYEYFESVENLFRNDPRLIITSEKLNLIKNKDLIFFPIDNMTKRGISEVQNTIEKVARQYYVSQEVPLRWIRCFDMMVADTEVSYLRLEKVKAMALKCGIKTDKEIGNMLDLLHQLGVVFYLTATVSLRDIVTIDPQWLIDNMMKLIPTTIDSDAKLNMTELKKVDLYEDWQYLENTAIVTRNLLEFFWGNDVDFMVDLLQRTMIMCRWSFRDNIHTKEGSSRSSDVETYLVPSVLPVRNILDEEAAASMAKCIFDFSDDFLPVGAFERLISLCVAYSEKINDEKDKHGFIPVLGKFQVKVCFGTNLMCYLWVDNGMNQIQLLVEDDNEDPGRCFNVVFSILDKINYDFMNNGLKWNVLFESRVDETKGQYFDLAESRDRDEFSMWFSDSASEIGFRNTDYDVFLELV